jgi:glycosyltransferase involved in cell wall biosynthesis
MRTVFAQDADIRVVYVGPETEHDGRPISAAIRDRLGDQSHRVFFTGRLPHEQALPWVRNSAALVLVSRIEAMPLVPIEAMSLGVPVVCADVGPGPEIVDNGIDGVLISPDDPPALAQSILALLKDPEKAKAMGEAGQRKVKEKFELAVCLRRTEAFYRKLLEQPEHV